MVRISVIVPALNEARCIERCLASVRAQRLPAEVVVVDGGSTDATAALAAPQARVLRGPRGRAVQMNAGARACTGDALLFLHADSALHPHALPALAHALRDPGVAGGTFTLRFDRDSPALRLYAACTRLPGRLFHYGDQGIFVRRAVFERLGGFRALPLMEDVDLLDRLRAHGRVALLPYPVTTSARRFARHGPVRQQLRNVALVGLFLMGVSAERLAGWYENVSR